MSARSSSPTPQIFRSAARSRLANRSRCATSACMAGSKRSRSLSWIARHSVRLRAHTPGGSNPCRMASTASTSATRRAELFGDRRQIAGEIAGLVDEIDEVLADHAPHRIGDRERRAARRDDRPASSRPTRRLRDCSRRRRGRRRRRRPIPNSRPAHRPCAGGPARRHREEVSSMWSFGALLCSPLGSPSLRSRSLRPRPAWRRQACGRRWLRRGAGGSLSAARLEQRIALELGVDIGDEVEVGELQQLDGLHQLRRHHQRLALPDLESLGQRHEGAGELVRFLLVCHLYSRTRCRNAFGLGLNNRSRENPPVIEAAGPKAGIPRPDRAGARRDC